ncbi:hypothetical protein [Actinoplanes sp. NPDC049118]|uniref:hypothetical protein n=1 Tax=Actinoplanes sp. NPDC049118 TaxID=3155769 RepID=UPI0033EAC71C
MTARRQASHDLDAEDRNALSDSDFAFPEPFSDAGHVRTPRSKADLYAEARRRRVRGRAKVTKAEPQQALD